MSSSTLESSGTNIGEAQKENDDLFRRVPGHLPGAEKLARCARAAFREIRKSPGPVRNAALLKMAELLLLPENVKDILEANRLDLAKADDNNLAASLKDRLRLDQKGIESMARALREIAAFPDPVGEVISGGRLANGVEMVKKRVPLGVVFTIFESRPNVTVDIGALCVKSGNAAILRGGKEALLSNQALYKIFARALEATGLPGDAIQLVGETDRAYMIALLRQESLVDLVVPRGGEGLIRFIVEHSKIPVVKHDKGVCNIYIDPAADLERALSITVNAKLQRSSVCNAVENLLIHKDFPEARKLLEGLSSAGALLRGDARAVSIYEKVETIADEDLEYSSEYLDKRLAVKVVDDMDSAIDFIHKYGSSHSEAIISEDQASINQFLASVDSAALFVNCSTRFHDGGQMGMGAEVGISTGRLHVRGPMGVKDLTTTTYVMTGEGQIRE